MNLNSRIIRLERTLANQHCDCPDNADLSWPGHQPHQHCQRCAGERLIYQLPHHPRDGEPLLREALPIINKTCSDNGHADLSKLTNQELQQLKRALQATQPAEAHDP